MSQPARVDNNAQTIVMNADTFVYETVESTNGNATMIRFPLDTQAVAGDVVVVLEQAEIHFHGMIIAVADGYATATDPRGSLLPATTIQ